LFIERDNYRACRQTDASTRNKLDVHPFVSGHFEDLVAERVAPDA
jgi:hypothetical protein